MEGWGRGCPARLESWQGMGCLWDSQRKHTESQGPWAHAARRRGLRSSSPPRASPWDTGSEVLGNATSGRGLQK